MSNPTEQEPSTRDFIQVTRGYVGDLRRLARRAPAARQVFDLICEKMNRSNALVISQTTMASILGYTRQTISSSVALLENESWLQIIKIGTSNAYVLNSKVVWRDVGGKRYSAFNARVYVSEEEQNKSAEMWEAVTLKQVPVLLPGEIPISDEEDLPPPDQKDLLPLDSRELPMHGEAPARDPRTVDFIDGKSDHEN